MIQQPLSQAIKHWHYIAPIAQYPQHEEQFNELVSELDELLEIVGDNEQHPLIGLVDMVGQLVASYEEAQFRDQQPSIKGIDALQFFMTQHNLKQSDLPEIGSQGVVSEILSGKRTLNVRQIVRLSKRFNVDFATFVDD